MALKLSCADFSFPLLSHDQSLDVIAMLGILGVDVGLFSGRSHLHPEIELKQVSRRAKALAQKLAERGLDLADVFLIPGTSFAENAPNHPDAAVRAAAREQFRRAIEYVVLAGGKHLTALPGVFWPGELRSVAMQRCISELSWRVHYAAENGVRYSVEPHIGSIISRPQAALDLVRHVPGLTLTLDYTHFTRVGIPDREIEPLVRHASHFHCRGACQGRLQTSFARNTIDYARVVKAMRRSRYSGYIAMEYVWQEWERCNESDNLSETIRFRDFFRGLDKRPPTRRKRNS
jgi:sugar phosphate isomerase/epimerase